jgi:hypothetical protein
MAKASYHVVPAPGGGWSVKKSGAVRASKHFNNKEDAERWAQEAVRSHGVEVYIHRRDGTVEQKAGPTADQRPARRKPTAQS